jgi:hypothetical protein
MAEYSTTPQLVITDTFSTLVTDFNTVSSGLGATGDLTTNVKTTIVGAINELEVGIRGVSNNLVATDLLTNANDLVGAINEIEGVFDASAKGISAGSSAFDITTTNASGISLDAPVVALTGDLTLVDGERIKLGTGADLQIYHDGNHSIIDETGTGNLFVRATNVNIQNVDADPDENMAVFNAGGSVDLYHDNAKKFETKSTGAGITGVLDLSSHLDMPDAAQIKLGDDDDFILQHIASGSVSSIQGEAVRIRNLAGTETMASFNADGSTNLFYNGYGKLATTSDGIDITGIVNLDSDAVIKGGTATAITLDNANVTIAGNTTVSGTLSVGSLTTTNQTVKLAIDELHGEVNTNTGNIATNTSAISANTSARNTNTSNITTNTTNITNNDSDISANATNISTNSGKIGTALSGNHLTAGNIGASLNTLASKIGNVTASTMGTDASTVVTAINELHLEIVDINTNGPDANASIIGTGNLDTNATTLKGAVNEIEGVFDASAFEISAGTNAFDVVSGAFTIDASGTISLDAATTALTGDLTLVDGEQIKLGTDADLTIHHTGSHARLINNTGNTDIRSDGQVTIETVTGTEEMAVFNANGSVDLYHNDVKKFETTSGGASITGQLDLSSHLDMPNNAIVKLGTADDLQIYHTGTGGHGNLDNQTGVLILTSSETRMVSTDDPTEIVAKFISGGSVELYENNSKKFETTTTGIDVTGNIDLDNGAKIRSNSADAITFAGANVTIAGNTTVSGTLSVGSLDTSSTTVAAAINELHTDIGTNTTAISSNDTDISTINTKLGTITTGVMLTSASNVGAAIGELHGDIGTNTTAITANTSARNTNTSNISTNTTGISNINTKLGTISSAAMGTTASNVSDAIDELRLSIPTIYNAAGTALN